MLTEIGRAAETLTVPPASVIVFGSFARGEAGRNSDLDVDSNETTFRLASGAQVWRDIRRDGRVVHGLSLNELAGVLSA